MREMDWCKWLWRIYDGERESGLVGKKRRRRKLCLVSVGEFFLCNKRQNYPGRSGVS